MDVIQPQGIVGRRPWSSALEIGRSCIISVDKRGKWNATSISANRVGQNVSNRQGSTELASSIITKLLSRSVSPPQ